MIIHRLLTIVLLASMISSCSSQKSGRYLASDYDIENDDLIPKDFSLKQFKEDLSAAEELSEMTVEPIYFSLWMSESEPDEVMFGSYDLYRERFNLSAPNARNARFSLEEQAKQLSLVVVHEYAHGVFENYMLKREESPWGKFVRNQIPRSDKKYYETLRFMKLAYHELFADIFAVIHFKKLSIFRDYVANAKMSTKLSIACRDFASSCVSSSSAAWKNELAKEFSKSNPESYKYLYFGPARAGFGSLFNRSVNARAAQEMVAKVALALAEDFDKRFSSPNAFLGNQDALIHNQEIVTELKSTLND